MSARPAYGASPPPSAASIAAGGATTARDGAATAPLETSGCDLCGAQPLGSQSGSKRTRISTFGYRPGCDSRQKLTPGVSATRQTAPAGNARASVAAVHRVAGHAAPTPRMTTGARSRRA